jgi:hypothetical protein
MRLVERKATLLIARNASTMPYCSLIIEGENILWPPVAQVRVSFVLKSRDYAKMPVTVSINTTSGIIGEPA